jgi:hypothetical protein
MVMAGQTQPARLATAGSGEEETLAAVEHLLTCMAALDPDTMEPMAASHGDSLERLSDCILAEHEANRCLVWRALQLVEASLVRILARPHVRLMRDARIQPLHKVQVTDAKSLAWLARQPGRDVREKVGARLRIKGVVRLESLDVPENRLVVRLASELEKALASHQLLGTSVAKLLARVASWAREAGIPAATRPTPTNVLLGHADYRRVWRAWRLLQGLPAWLSNARRDLLSPVVQTLKASLTAALARQPGVTLLEGWSRVSLQASGLAWNTDRPPQLLFRDSRGQPLRAKIDCSANSVRVEIIRYSDGPVRRMASSQNVEFEVVLQSAGGCAQLTVLTEVGELQLFEGLADRAGLASASHWMASQILAVLGIAARRRDATATPECLEPWRWAACDLGATPPRVLSDTSRQCLRGAPAVSAASDDETAGALVLHGATARAVPPGPGRQHRGLATWFSAPNEHDLVAPAALRNLFAPLGRGHGRGHVAWIVPDDADPATMATLRGALPPVATVRWFVPRSVCAALASTVFRSGAEPLPDRYTVFVVDAGAPRLTATLLTLRRDGLPSESAEASAAWLERLAPFAACPHAETCSDAGFALGRARSALGESDDAHESLCLARESGDLEGWLYGGQPLLLPCPESADLLWELPAAAASQADPAPLASWLAAFREQQLPVLLQRAAGDFTVLVVGRIWRRGSALSLLHEALGPRARVEVLDDEAIVRGGIRCLERHGRGLPTWRDFLPDLWLELGPGKYVELLPSRAVAPGERICHVAPHQFELKEANDTFLFGLRRGQGADRLDYAARLSSPSFPLRAPVRVSATVDFVYAQDAFTVTLQPLEGERAPFAALTVEWIAGKGPQFATPRLVDEPPEFPSATAFELPAASLSLAPQVAKINELVRRTFRLPRQPQSDDLQAMSMLVQELGRTVRKHWSAGTPPGTLRTIAKLEPVVQWLSHLAGAGSLAGHVPAKQVQDKKPKLAIEALRTLSYFRGDAPAELVLRLFDDLGRSSPGEAEAERLRALGRVCAFAPASMRERALEMMLARVEIATALPPVAPTWWSLATACWSAPEFVPALSIELAGRLLAACERALTANAPMEKAAQSVYGDIGAVIIALLRRRAQPSRDERFAAGTQTALRLADQLEALAVEFRNRDWQLRSRLEFGHEADGKALAFAEQLTAALREESVARVRLLQEG